MKSSSLISEHFRLTPIQIRGLRKLGIVTVRDLLYHFPARYDEGGSESAITGLVAGTSVTIFGTIGKLATRRSWKRKIPVGEAVITDASGSIKVMWFHQPYVAKKFTEGMFVKAVGTVAGKSGKPYLANPHVEIADPIESGLFKATSSKAKESPSSGLFAIYPESLGITSLWFRHAIDKLSTGGAFDALDDPIPGDMRDRYNLPDLKSALLYIHKPVDRKHAEAARKRFAFEEILAIQLTRAKERTENDAHASFPIRDGALLAKQFLDSITFPPTHAQERAIADILSDFGNAHPMARLLEGDVGSGKTLVAAATAYAVVSSRPPSRGQSPLRRGDGPRGRTSGTLQVAYMAPTEILANQHFQSFIEYFKELPINIALMTGSGCKKFPSKVNKNGATTISRAQLLKWIENGEIAMLVGTHALIQKSVQFQHLAYAIVDEQHRFGVNQRKALVRRHTQTERGTDANNAPHESASSPHFLSMTATPIPRTLSLTVYGDLDLSLLDELPPGRAKISTKIVKPEKRAEAYEAVRAELKKGRQAYVICPRIEEPDPAKANALQARSAKAEAKRLKAEIFPEYEVGLLHGAMKPSEKDEVMRRFTKGELQVLVATSVVEVGVNVENATAIMIEGAERFGLAQLHQLRGRVMRSSHPPICFLLTDSKSDVSQKRLRALEGSDDGFKLAEADLLNRGAGDLFGRQQWGMSDLGMEALKNPRLIKAAREEAQRLIAEDPLLSKYPALAERVTNTFSELHNE